jgi:hypothetical protein
MDKLQQVIATIIKSPLGDQEKISWIEKFTSATSPEELKTRLEEISQYFDSFAEKYEDEVRLYDKYLAILEKFQMEMTQVQQKPPPPIPPVATSVSTAVTQPSSVQPVVSQQVATVPAPNTNPSNSPSVSSSPSSINSANTLQAPVSPLSSQQTDLQPVEEVDELYQIKQTIAQLQRQANQKA